MASCREGIAVIDVHHLLGCQIVFDIVDEPVFVDLRLQGTTYNLFGNRTRLLVGHLVHEFKDVAEWQFDNLHTVTRTDEFRVTDDALQTESRHRTVGQHQRTRVGYHLAHPQDMGNLVEVFQVHADVSLDTDTTAIGSEVDAFVAVLQDDHGFAIAFQFRNAPVHTEEEIYLVQAIFYLLIDIALNKEPLIIAGIHCRQHLYFRSCTLQRLHGIGKSFVCRSSLCLGCHIFCITCTAGTFPEVGMGEASHDGAHHQLQIHRFLFHNVSVVLLLYSLLQRRYGHRFVVILLGKLLAL